MHHRAHVLFLVMTTQKTKQSDLNRTISEKIFTPYLMICTE